MDDLGLMISSEAPERQAGPDLPGGFGAIVSQAQWAEEHGFAGIWMGEGRLANNAIVPITLIAAHTKRINVGSGILPYRTRNPALMAVTWKTLDGLAPGRMRPGLEAEAVHRAVALSEVAGSPLYIVHLSSVNALEEVVAARDRGLNVFAETCPQILLPRSHRPRAARLRRIEIRVLSPPYAPGSTRNTSSGACVPTIFKWWPPITARSAVSRRSRVGATSATSPTVFRPWSTAWSSCIRVL